MKFLGIQQQPGWENLGELEKILCEIRNFPGIVSVLEIELLKKKLASVAQGESFLLQGGDCAESFQDFSEKNIVTHLETMLDMVSVLGAKSKIPIVRVGRIAGQFAKPRSFDNETRLGVTLPAYRGDAVNGYEFSFAARKPDPKRLLQAYYVSVAVYSFIKNFFQASREDFFVSHEALLLDYEAALVKNVAKQNSFYATSGHFLWVGERTRDVAGAHVEFLAKVRNPIGVKLSSNVSSEEVLALIDKLDPERELGRLTFITRMGHEKIRDVLPELVSKVKASGAKVLWVCDPMHGNTFLSNNGYKTRMFDHIVDEVRGFFAVHKALGTVAGGLHVEFTGEDVFECLGGTNSLEESFLGEKYKSLCDPRLNYGQVLSLLSITSGLLVA